MLVKQSTHNPFQLPVLNTGPLSNDCLRQKAHTVLASLVHYYVHSMPEVEEGTCIRVPRSLAVPLVEVSHDLRIAPVLTFADVVLWNYDIDPAVPFIGDNFHFRVIFSGTEDERNFYASSAQAELFGAALLPIMHRYLTMEDVDNAASVDAIAEDLISMRDTIEEISRSIQGVRRTVDPKVFYDAIRPWWVGSTSERPWVYEGVRETNLDLDGPSAGQSAVMHSLDVYLNIYGTRTQKDGSNPLAGSGGFMERMRRYMPGAQRDFLARLAATHRPLREVARARPALRTSYNDAVRALTKLRDLHIRIATLYVISMSKSAPLCPFAPRMSRTPSSGSPARGTGGNEVSALLKAGRDATKRAVIED